MTETLASVEATQPLLTIKELRVVFSSGGPILRLLGRNKGGVRAVHRRVVDDAEGLFAAEGILGHG